MTAKDQRNIRRFVQRQARVDFYGDLYVIYDGAKVVAADEDALVAELKAIAAQQQFQGVPDHADHTN